MSLQSLSPVAAMQCFCWSQALYCLGTLPVFCHWDTGRFPHHNHGSVSRQWEFESRFCYPLAV